MDDVRRTGMRNRVAVLVAVLAFASLAVVLAVVVAGGPGDRPLPKLPLAASASAGAERTGAATDAAAMSMPATATTYRLEGAAPSLAGEAPAYRLARGDVRAAVADLAAALGVQGAVEKRAEAWTVREGDREVTVHEAPGVPWYLGPATTCPDRPVSSDVEADIASCAVASDQPLAAGAAPAKEKVEAAVRPVFERLGLGFDGLEVADGMAVVRPRVDGKRTFGYEHGLTVGAEGTIVGGHGWLGRPESLGAYPVVGVQEALERLRTGFGYGPRTMAGGIEPAIAVADADCAKETVVCDPPPDGGKPQEVVLTGVEMGLQLIEGHLVPAYLFAVGEGDGPAVVAVEDRFLEGIAPEPKPEPDPSSEPGPGPDGGGTGGSEACSGSASASAPPEGGSEPADQPMSVEVCGPATAVVGEEVAFEVTATDPDAEIVESGCGAPQARFGDEDQPAMGTCLADCATPLKERSPGKLGRTFRHTYAKPGTYTAAFQFQSALCTKGSSVGEARHTIVVR